MIFKYRCAHTASSVIKTKSLCSNPIIAEAGQSVKGKSGGSFPNSGLAPAGGRGQNWGDGSPTKQRLCPHRYSIPRCPGNHPFCPFCPLLWPGAASPIFREFRRPLPGSRRFRPRSPFWPKNRSFRWELGSSVAPALSGCWWRRGSATLAMMGRTASRTPCNSSSPP